MSTFFLFAIHIKKTIIEKYVAQQLQFNFHANGLSAVVVVSVWHLDVGSIPFGRDSKYTRWYTIIYLHLLDRPFTDQNK